MNAIGDVNVHAHAHVVRLFEHVYGNMNANLICTHTFPRERIAVLQFMRVPICVLNVVVVVPPTMPPVW